MKTLAPIVLFVYNRPEYTRQTLEALSKNDLADQSILYIYADGAKEDATDAQRNAIRQVKDVVKSKQWCKNVILRESDGNKGLAQSVIKGVTEVVNDHEKIIVLEDDLLTSPYFLRFLNKGLEVYQDEGNVYSINSYIFPIQTDMVGTFLSPLATSTWGWATWADRWKVFEVVSEYKSILQNNPFLRDRFNLGDYDFTRMLDNSNSWGIRWYYSVFIRNGLGLFPTRPLVQNIGFGSGATHTKMEFEQAEIWQHDIEMVLHEKIDFQLHSKMIEHFTGHSKKNRSGNSIFDRVKRRFK